jgi:hypothetical protein
MSKLWAIIEPSLPGLSFLAFSLPGTCPDRTASARVGISAVKLRWGILEEFAFLFRKFDL